MPQPNVQLGEVPGILDPVNEFLDEGKGIAVLDSVFIELPIVLYRSQGSIPFENEKEWRRHWRVGVTNSARPKVFLDEAVQGLLFVRGEGVDLAVGGYKILVQLDAVIPHPMGWQLVASILTEDIWVLMEILFWAL